MPLIRLVLLLWGFALAISAFGQYETGSPWPKFHADNSNSGLGSAGNSNGITRWNANSAGAKFGYSTPVIGSDGSIYVIDYTGVVYAFSSAGVLLWTTAVINNIYGSPAIGMDGSIYVVDCKGVVYALSSGPRGGALLWTASLSDVFYSSPAIGPDGIIYVAGYSGRVYALSTGSAAGSILWKAQTDGAFMSTCPVIGADGTIYLGSYDNSGGVYALTSGPVGGTILWKTDVNDRIGGAPAIGKDGTVYVATLNGHVDAFSPGPTGGDILWRNSMLSSFYSGPAIGPDGRVYVLGYHGAGVWALSPGSTGGEVLWKISLGNTLDYFNASPTISSDGRIYAASTTGKVYAVGSGPSGGSVLWTNTDIGSTYLGSPAIGSDGALYVASTLARLRAIGTEVDTVPIRVLDIKPATVDGGTKCACTVILSKAAPSGGDVVRITSSDPSVAVPAFVTIPSGQRSAAFEVAASLAAATTTITLTAESGGAKVGATLTVLGDSLFSLGLSPNVVIGGKFSTGTVTLTSPAPVGGWRVNLSAQYPAEVTVPARVTIAEGSTHATFTIRTKKLQDTMQCAIYAADSVSQAKATLEVDGDSTSGVARLSPLPINESRRVRYSDKYRRMSNALCAVLRASLAGSTSGRSF